MPRNHSKNYNTKLLIFDTFTSEVAPIKVKNNGDLIAQKCLGIKVNTEL